jgi:hypothetical protein
MVVQLARLNLRRQSRPSTYSSIASLAAHNEWQILMIRGNISSLLIRYRPFCHVLVCQHYYLNIWNMLELLGSCTQKHINTSLPKPLSIKVIIYIYIYIYIYEIYDVKIYSSGVSLILTTCSSSSMACSICPFAS